MRSKPENLSLESLESLDSFASLDRILRNVELHQEGSPAKGYSTCKDLIELGF